MSKILKSIRGTNDILKKEMRIYRFIVENARKISETFGFDTISTPIIEYTDVFSKNLGNTSDVVNKEMYTFNTKSNESITLRPEGTAGFIRSFIQNNLYDKTPYRAFYEGPMFRYERPQKGRQRQFHQFGAELVGINVYNADVEIISLGWEILKKLNIQKYITLNINTIGDDECRTKYKVRLVEYLEKFYNELSQESKVRIKKNPLRVLDSKSPKDVKILVDAPKFKNYLNRDSNIFYENICNNLDAINIPYVQNQLLVRGFDYYCHTVFEFNTNKIGTQNTIIGGGRYNNLAEMMGGKSIASIGFAAGIERLMLMLQDINILTKIVTIIKISKNAEIKALKLSQNLRKNNIRVEMSYSENIKKSMKYANKINANFAIIIGDKEYKNNYFTIKNLFSGNQEIVNDSKIIEYIKEKL